MKPDDATTQKARQTPPAADAPEDRQEAQRQEAQRQKPAAGPHAKPQLTDPEKTPGAGALPDPDKPRDPDATG